MRIKCWKLRETAPDSIVWIPKASSLFVLPPTSIHAPARYKLEACQNERILYIDTIIKGKQKICTVKLEANLF